MKPVKIKTKRTNCIICKSNHCELLTTGYDYEYKSCSNIFRIVRCKTCRNIYLNPKPALSEFSKIYPDDYYSYDFLNKKFSLAKIGKRLIEKGYVKLYGGLIGSSGAILDVGCGDGRLLALLNKAGCNWELHGVDFNKKGNKIAEEKGLNIHYGKFEDVKFQRESFDLVIMNEVLEHLYDPSESLTTVREILKFGGYLVIETPCINSWDYRIFKNSYWGGYHIPRHINIFSRETIKSILKNAGFRVVKEESLLSPPFWILSMHNLLLDKGYSKKVVGFFNFYNPLLLMMFTLIDLIQKQFGHTSTMRIIARK